MEAIKSYTDLEQSKKLAEILPLESADMCFANDGTAIKIDANSYNVRKHMWKDIQLIPCWSLAALLSVLPDYTMQTNTDGKVFVVCESKKPMVYAYDNPVDACVAMVEKLHELNLL